jgi:hypothetical protein
MPRTHFYRSVATQISSVLEANLTQATDPVAQQLRNAARPRMMSTVARAEGLLARSAAASTASLKPCSCGKVVCAGHCSCGRAFCPGHARSMSTASAAPHVQPAWATDARAPGLAERLAEVTKHFPTALSVDDFMSRVEVALAGYGFTGDNSIGKCAGLDWGRLSGRWVCGASWVALIYCSLGRKPLPALPVPAFFFRCMQP